MKGRAAVHANRHDTTSRKLRPRAVQDPAPAVVRATLAERLIFGTLTLSTIAVPIFYSRVGADAFRVPKMALFTAEGIVIIAIASLALVWRTGLSLRFRRDEWLAAAIIGWTAITTATSTNPLVSAYSLATVICGVAIFFAARQLAFHGRAGVLAIIFIPALVNAFVLFLGQFHIWSPYFDFSHPVNPNSLHYQNAIYAALLGNTNDAAVFYIVPALVAFAMALRSRREQTFPLAALFALLAIAVFTSHSLGASAALAAGLLTIGMRRPKGAAIILLIVTVTFAAAFFTIAPFQERAERALQAFRMASWNDLVTGRLLSFLAAVEMFRSHPIAGVGPGRFAGEFLDYKLTVMEKYPRLFRGSKYVTENFGEVHNDHLQTLAETGLPGLLLMLAVLILLLRGAKREDSHEQQLARVLLPALVVSFAVAAFAQFPLHVAGVLSGYLYVAGLCWGWSAAR